MTQGFEEFVNKIICGDCLEVMKDWPDNCVDLVLTDPPYNIGKDSWDRIDNYIQWSGKWLNESGRVLKEMGSLYFPHNDIIQLSELIRLIKTINVFTFKQFIVWNKRFTGASTKGYLDGYVAVDNLRNYQQMAEYYLYYIKQTNVPLIEFANYIRTKRHEKKLTTKQARGLLGLPIYKGCGNAGWLWFETGRLPAAGEYKKLKEVLNLDNRFDSLLAVHTFNNQKTHHSVWDYEIANSNGHPTPKPLDLLFNIILHSSSIAGLILDPFCGSGTTCVAAKMLGRRFIGIDISEKYCEIARMRLKAVDTGVSVKEQKIGQMSLLETQ